MDPEEALRQAKAFLNQSQKDITKWAANADLSAIAPGNFHNSFPITRDDVIKATKELGKNSSIDSPAKAILAGIILPGYKAHLGYMITTGAMANHSQELGEAVFKPGMQITEAQYTDMYNKLGAYQGVLNHDPVNPVQERAARAKFMDSCSGVVSGAVNPDAGGKLGILGLKLAEKKAADVIDAAPGEIDKVKKAFDEPDNTQKLKKLYEVGKGWLGGENTVTPEQALKNSGVQMPTDPSNIAGVSPDKVKDYAAHLAAQQTQIT